MDGDAQSEQNGNAAPPNFDKLWNYSDPAGTEAAFRKLLPAARDSGDVAYLVELQSQIARTQGLQQKFDEAHATLDEAEALLGADMFRARARVLLERGRVINSSGKPTESVVVFERALQTAQDAGLEYYAVDAAHMLGIATSGDTSIAWNEKALALAESATEPRARKWAEVLYNNLGWTYFGLGRYGDALRMFEAQLPIVQAGGNATNIGICRWSTAKMYRHLGRVDEALAIQLELLDRPGLQDEMSLGYTHEEIGECLLMLGREAEARPHFAQAWERLHGDPWLARDEAGRLERIRRLGGAVDGSGQER